MEQPAELESSRRSPLLEPSSFRADALRRPSLAYATWLVLAMVFSYLLSRLYADQPLSNVRPSVFFFFFIVTVHLVKRSRDGGVAALLAPDVLFVGVYTAFHQGYLALWTLGIVPYSDVVFHFEPTMPLSLLIVNLGLLSAILGFELYPRGQSTRFNFPPIRIPTPGWGFAGITVMLVGMAMHVTTLLAVGIGLFVKHGYTAVARLNEFVGRPWSLIWARSPQVFLLGVTIYAVYSALKHRKLFGSRAVLLFVVGSMALFVLEGSRGPVFLVSISLLIVRQYLVKPIKLPIAVALALGFITLFTAMKTVRGWALSPGAMVEEWSYARTSGEVHWWSSVVEAGSSVRIASMVTSIVPDQAPFWYGQSWLSAAAKLVPFLQSRLMNTGILREAPSQWITYEISGTGAAGLGFSLPVEGYLNFGLPGVIMEMMFFGALLRAVCVWFARRPSACTALIMLGVIAPTIRVVRDHASLVTFVYLQTIVFAWLLHILFGHEVRGHTAERGEPQESPTQAAYSPWR